MLVTNQPAWLRTHLETIGLADTDGFTLTPRAGRCRRCHAPIIRALDSEPCGLPTRADPHPLNAYGELWARQQHRPTYELTRRGTRLRLDRRGATEIRSRPPDATDRRWDVLVAHACYLPPLEPLTTMPVTTIHAIRTAFQQYTEPPF